MMTYQLTGDEALAQGVWEARGAGGHGLPGFSLDPIPGADG